MKTHVNLYIGKGIRNHGKLIKSLTGRKLPSPFYFVAFEDEGTRLNIFSSLLFAQKYYKDRNMEIVAIVKSKDDAFEYIRGLSEISVRKFNDFDARKVIDSLSGFEIEMLKKQAEEREQEEWLS
ncbi:MAG: hypothetical protein K6E19_02555 [Lachnospiraceae bacterium]|nr:hypothetical protein [Lachnospiraceae bacterium]